MDDRPHRTSLKSNLAADVGRFLPAIIISVGLVLRLVGLRNLPVFNDEAIYGRWIQLILSHKAVFISLSDGKQPLYYWLSAMLLSVAGDPVWALRLVSALAGAAGVLGVYLAGGKLGGRRAGFLAAWVYAVIPFALAHDRLGFPDGLLAAIAPWVFWLALKLRGTHKPTIIISVGVLLAAALLVKTTGVILFLVFFGGLVLAGSDIKSQIINNSLAVGIAIVPTLAIMALVQGGGFIVGKSSGFLMSPGELARLPFAQWGMNIALIWSWLVGYAGWANLVVLAVGFGVFRAPERKAYFIVAMLAAAPFFIMGLAARTVFSRYTVMSVPFIALAVGLTASNLISRPTAAWQRRMQTVVILLILSVPLLWQDFLLINHPSRFAWAKDDRWQYVEGWPSGYGLNDIVLAIREEAKQRGRVVVLVDQQMGLPRDALDMYFNRDRQVTIVAVDAERLPPVARKPNRAYLLVMNHPRVGEDVLRKSAAWRLRMKFYRPRATSYFGLYEPASEKN